MDIYEAIKTRTSVRGYRSPRRGRQAEEDSRRCAARPLGEERTAVDLYRYQGLETRKKLVAACKGQSYVGEAPVVVAVVRQGRARVSDRWEDTGNSLPVDIGISLEHLMLAAAAEGLGTCWIGAFIEADVREILGVPAEVKIVALTPVGTRRGNGYDAEKPLEEIRCTSGGGEDNRGA